MRPQRRSAVDSAPCPCRTRLPGRIPDYQALGGPGKTTIYAKGKTGELKLFIDGAGRTMVDGDSGRALLGMPSWKTRSRTRGRRALEARRLHFEALVRLRFGLVRPTLRYSRTRSARQVVPSAVRGTSDGR